MFIYQAEHALRLLRKSLGNPEASFREGQWEAIDELVNNRNKMLIVERTGWGKSAVYFIATWMFRHSGKKISKPVRYQYNDELTLF